MNYTLIKTNQELNTYLKSLEEKKTHIIALDIEAELNCHAYGEKLCLVQINDDGRIIIIDPLHISNAPLKKLFESRHVLKVMYDASSDLSLMKNAHEIEIKSILDLRPAVDLLNYEARNLHSVIAAELGVLLTGKSRFQKHNWTRRPLSPRAIEYAVSDVLYLLKLKDAIMARLASEKLMDLFFLKNLQVQNREYRRDPADRYRKVRGYHGLSEKERAVFRDIYDIRDKFARRINMPSHNIVNNAGLVRLVQDAAYLAELRFPKRLDNTLTGQIRQELSAALANAPGGGDRSRP